MKKRVLLLLSIIISANIVNANDQYYDDNSPQVSQQKVIINPIAQWLDDQVDKAYIQKKKETVKQNTQNNNGFSGYNSTKQYQPWFKKPVVNSGWSS